MPRMIFLRLSRTYWIRSDHLGRADDWFEENVANPGKAFLLKMLLVLVKQSLLTSCWQSFHTFALLIVPALPSQMVREESPFPAQETAAETVTVG